MAETRNLLPKSQRDLPEVTEDGAVIGWIRQVRVPHANSEFFEARGIHPENGRVVNLELSTVFADRFEKLLDFHHHPEHYYRRHWM